MREELEAAQKIFVVYGTFSVAFGFVLGLPISRIRMAAPTAPRHLLIAHLAAIIQGALHLSFVVAAGFSLLPGGVEVGAALLLATGSALFVLGATVNWLQNVGDHFAVRSLGWKLLAVSAPAHISGMAILLIGVVRSLLA